MKAVSITILGGPDSGKSNFIGALWMKLRRNRGRFRIAFEPDDIEYVNRIVGHLRHGKYPPRTEPDEGAPRFRAPIAHATDPKTPIADLMVPDMAGEIWKVASRDREIDQEWIDRLRGSEAAMLFVRFGSDENVDAPDWITSAKLMELEGGADDTVQAGPPTQLFLCDLLNLLEEYLGLDTDLENPRVAIVIAAWDGVGPEERMAGPKKFIEADYPMLHGRVMDRSRLSVRSFGLSATGCDLNDKAAAKLYLETGPSEMGFVETDGADGVKNGDILTLLEWVIEGATE